MPPEPASQNARGDPNLLARSVVGEKRDGSTLEKLLIGAKPGKMITKKAAEVRWPEEALRATRDRRA